jgi:hypothetical protein
VALNNGRSTGFMREGFNLSSAPRRHPCRLENCVFQPYFWGLPPPALAKNGSETAPPL